VIDTGPAALLLSIFRRFSIPHHAGDVVGLFSQWTNDSAQQSISLNRTDRMHRDRRAINVKHTPWLDFQ
jgi:hypothetical protein